VTDGQVNAAGYRLGTLGTGEPRSGELTLGIRPEYLGLVPPGDAGSLPARVRQVQDIGTYVLVSLDAAGMNLKARLSPEAAAPRVGDTVGAQVLNAHTCCYNQNEELVP
jgi:glycerol transport system ATP-binding protein